MGVQVCVCVSQSSNRRLFYLKLNFTFSTRQTKNDFLFSCVAKRPEFPACQLLTLLNLHNSPFVCTLKKHSSQLLFYICTYMRKSLSKESPKSICVYVYAPEH